MHSKAMVLLAALLSSSAVPALAVSHGHTVAVTEADNGATVRVASGGKLTLTVMTNGGIPYVWKITSEVAPHLILKGHDEVPITPGLPGGAAKVTFSFTASEPGEATLSAGLMSITGGAPARTVSVTVDVTR
jgi:predicted secreted protein